MEIKCSEMISNNQTIINNFDLWLSDSNLILIDNIKKNNPYIELPLNYNRSQTPSKIANKMENSVKKCSPKICNKYERTNAALNPSDLLIANFVKNLNQDFIYFKSKKLSEIEYANSENQLFEMSLSFKIGEKCNNLNKKDLLSLDFTEKINNNYKDLMTYLNENKQNLSFECQNNNNNKRKRNSEDIEILLNDDFPIKQIKLENESVNNQAKKVKEILYKKKNLSTENAQIKTELSNNMDNENENTSSKVYNDNIHFSNNSTNNTQYLHNNVNAGNNNYFNQSTNSNIIPEQPSKEQDISFTPQKSNQFSLSKAIKNNLNTKELNKDNQKNQELLNKISEHNHTFKPLFIANKIQYDSISLNSQIGKLNETTCINSKAINIHFINPTVDLTSQKYNENKSIENKNRDINSENNIFKLDGNNLNSSIIFNPSTDSNLIKNNKNIYHVESNNLIVKPENTDNMSFKSLMDFENNNITSKKKSEFFYLNIENKNDDLYFNSNANQKEKNNIIRISNDSSDKRKQKKKIDSIRRLTLSKNYLEDNIHHIKEYIVSSLKKNESANFNLDYKNNHDTKNKEKIDIVHTDKYYESETVNSIKITEHYHILNKNDSKNKIFKSDSNLKNSKKKINNEKISNKDNRNRGKSNSKNKYLNIDGKFYNTVKEQIMNNNIQKFYNDDNFQSKKALNRIELNQKNHFNKKENLLNSIINKDLSSQHLIKTFDPSNQSNKIHINLNNPKKVIDSNWVTNFKEEFQYGLDSKLLVYPKDAKIESKNVNLNFESKAEKNIDLIDLKIKKILKISSFDESQSDFTKSDIGKNLIFSTNNKNRNNDHIEINGLYSGKVHIQNITTQNPSQIANIDKNTQASPKITNLEDEQKKIIPDFSQNNFIHQLHKPENMLQPSDNLEKEESDIQLENKCISHDFKKSRTKEIENNLVKKLCVYELTDETPKSSDYEESDDNKKKKRNPQWALDKIYIKQRILEQNDQNIYEEVFGKRHKIEYLDLGNIFTNANSEFDIRGDSADWKMDNTMSSRRYNRQSRINRIDEELNDNHEIQMFSNFKKTNRNLYNDFKP